MTLPTALAESCDTYFYQLGSDFYTLPPNRGQPLQHWASGSASAQPTGIDIGPETRGLSRRPSGGKRRSRARPTERRDRPALEAGRLDPARDRPEGHRRDAAPDGALLRDDRERRQARDAARRCRTSSSRRRPGSRRGAAPLRRAAARADRRRPGRAPGRPRGPLRRRRTRDGTSYGVFGKFPIPIAGKTGTAEKVVNAARLPAPAQLRPVLVVRLRAVPTTRRSSSAR